MPERWQHWSGKEILRLEELRGEGMTARQIAQALGRPHHSVRTRLFEAGLSRPRVAALRWLHAFSEPHTIRGMAEAMGTTTQVVRAIKCRLRRAGFPVRSAEPARFGRPQ